MVVNKVTMKRPFKWPNNAFR